MSNSSSHEHSSGKLLLFPIGGRKRIPEKATGERVITPEMVGTVLVYRYYGETGNTYSVNMQTAARFYPYMQMLGNMYGLTIQDGQADEKGEVHEKFIFEQTSPARVPPEKRFCAVLQLGEEGIVTSVSFRMLPNRQISYSTSSPQRLRVIARNVQ